MASLDDLIKDFNKKAKEQVVNVGLSTYSYEKVPFTSPRLNYCTFGGLAIGKIVEFFGEEHGGKTTTALDVVANYQNMFPDRKVLYVDAENSLDVEWAQKIGVDVSTLIIMQPQEQSAEEIFDFIYKAVDTHEIGMWVLDSIGVLMSQQAWDKDLTEKTYAGISKALTDFSMKIVAACKKHNCLGLGINQVRDDLNSTWGGYKTPGGREWKHICSARIEFRRGQFIDEKGNALTRSAENPAGNIVNFTLTKIKTCPPTRRTGYYTINYDIGIDYLRDLIEVAIKYGIIDQKGAWFTIIDTETGEILQDKIQGQAKLYSLLEDTENMTILKRIEEIITNLQNS